MPLCATGWWHENETAREIHKSRVATPSSGSELGGAIPKDLPRATSDNDPCLLVLPLMICIATKRNEGKMDSSLSQTNRPEHKIRLDCVCAHADYREWRDAGRQRWQAANRGGGQSRGETAGFEELTALDLLHLWQTHLSFSRCAAGTRVPTFARTAIVRC